MSAIGLLLLSGKKRVTSSDSDVTAWIAAVQGGGGSVSQARVNIWTPMVAGIKSDLGISILAQQFDGLAFYVGEDVTNGPIQNKFDFAARRQHTLVGSPVFTPNQGLAGDGSSARIGTGYNPFFGPQYGQNNGSFGGWIQTNDSRTTGSPAYFGTSSQVAGGTNLTRQNATQNNYCVQDGTAGANNATMSPTTGVGLVHLDRTGATAEALYQNGVSRATAVTASTTVTNAELFALACNNGSGTAVLFSNGTLAMTFAAKSFGAPQAANFYTRVHTALNAINAANFP